LAWTPRASRKVESSMWEMKPRRARSQGDRSSAETRPETGRNYTHTPQGIVGTGVPLGLYQYKE